MLDMTPTDRSAVPEPLRSEIDEDARRHADEAPPIGPEGLKRLRELLQPVKRHGSTRNSSTDSSEGASG